VARALARILGGALALLLVAVVALGLHLGFSVSGWAMLAGVAGVVAGVLSARRRGARALAGAGLALLGLVVLGRTVLAGRGSTTMVTLPAATTSRWLARVIDEQDPCLVGALGVVRAWTFLPPDEQARLVPSMREAYAAMRASEGTTPSPVLDTLLGRQDPEAFDALVVAPRAGAPRAAVVFLHGWGGSYSLECWMMAEAARAIDALTVCPATGFEGRWWAAEGERTLRATLAYVKARGISRVYLAGLSNGGIGASRLAPRLAPSLAGLILISGAAPDGSTAGLPTLVVQGASDANVSAGPVRAFAARSGATYVELAGGHFVMMIERAEVRDAIARWLRARGGG
jgi:predicted esterase